MSLIASESASISPWADIAHCTCAHGRNQLWTHEPLCAESWVSIVAKSGPLGGSFSNWTHQDGDRLCPRSTKSHVSFYSLPRRFVDVTLHSADATNPSVVPQELGISFATFGIQRRASLSLNPFQIISSFHPFLCILLPFPSSWILCLRLILPTIYFTMRPWFWKIELQALFEWIIAHNRPLLAMLFHWTLLATAAISINMDLFSYMLNVLFETSFKCVHAILL